MDYRRPWQKIARTPMFATVVSGGNLQHHQTTSIGVLFINYRKKVLNVNYKLYSDHTAVQNAAMTSPSMQLASS